MRENADLWVKTFTAISPNEILEWADVFAEVTKLSPSVCLSVYAELTMMEDVNMLFVAASQRHSSITIAEMREEQGETDSEFVEPDELISEYMLYSDEFLGEMDADHQTERFEYFTCVLAHHNFSRLFIRLFIQNLSPTSEIIPKKFDIRLEDIFDTEFDPTPYISEFEDDDEENLFGGGENFLESLRLSKPVLPEGWLAIFKHLGITIKTNQGFRDQFQDPFFYAVDTKHTVPVFICGPLKTPYDDEDPAANQLKYTFETAIEGHYDQAFLFYSSPISHRESEDDGAQVTYWGEVYIDGEWRTMVLTERSTSIEAIFSLAKLTSNTQSDMKNPELVENSSELIHVWSNSHVDPMLSMMQNMFKPN